MRVGDYTLNVSPGGPRRIFPGEPVSAEAPRGAAPHGIFIASGPDEFYLAGSGLNITVWSYVDQLNVSVLSDGATVDDPHELTDAIIDEFVEIRRAAGLSEKLTVIESAMAQA